MVSLTQLTHAHTATARVSPHCIYVLVSGAISIRDPYICAIHESVPTNCMLSSIGQLSVE